MIRPPPFGLAFSHHDLPVPYLELPQQASRLAGKLVDEPWWRRQRFLQGHSLNSGLSKSSS